MDAPSIAAQFAAELQKKSHRKVALNKLNGVRYSEHAQPYFYEVIAGSKFDKIVHRLGQDGTPSVHAFVEKSSGKLIKAASWATPAKDKNGTPAYRYDLSTPEGFAHALYNADDHGAYLYADYVPVDDPNWLDSLPKAEEKIPTPVEPKVVRRVTFTIDVLDTPLDSREPLTWGQVRKSFEKLTPENGALEVAAGFDSGPVDYNLVWGRFRITNEEV